jgi:2-hydroxychromene-2-carboxylate isomerase
VITATVFLFAESVRTAFCRIVHGSDTAHPYRSQSVARIYYWLEEHRPELAVPFAKSALKGHFVDGLELGQPEVALGLANDVLGGSSELERYVSSPKASAKLRSMTSEALSKGVFGSPFFIADGEPFWGWDRLDLLERWLRTGDWTPKLLVISRSHEGAINRS